MSDISEPELPQAESFATSSVVTTVFDAILRDVHEGRLLPGTRISDSDFAEKLGVSRTPVREALQRLREIGIIEASPNRFTRIAIISPKQTADAMVVWLALYGALVAEVISLVPADMVLNMRADHERFVEHLMNPDPQKLATANADFFSHMVTLSSNPALQRGITSVVHQVRLGSQYLPEYIDLRAVSVAQDLLVHACRDHDRAAALGSMRMLGLIEVPTESPEDTTTSITAAAPTES